jgi:hypothetical protein
MNKYIVILLISIFLSCGSKNPKSHAVMKLKDGTTIEGKMTDPSHYVAGATKKLSIKTKDGKIKYNNDEIEQVTISGENKVYNPIYSHKFFSTKKNGKVKYIWMTPVSVTNGKAKLYSAEQEQTNQKGRYIGTSTYYYVWKDGEDACDYLYNKDIGLSIGAGSVYRTMIKQVFSDCPDLVKKSKDEKYKPNNKSVIDVVNEYNSMCGNKF